MTVRAPTPPLPPPALSLTNDYERGSPLARPILVAGVLSAHMLGAWGLLQVESVRQAVGEVAPLMVDLIAPPAPATPPPPPPPPPKMVKPPPAPTPIVAAAPSPAPAPPAFLVPPAPEQPPPPVVTEAPPPPPAPPAPPAPAPQPKTVPATAVEYVDAPSPTYPAASRRLNESGRVLIRVEIDTQGRARQVQLTRSSGSSRLDEAALAAVRAARFKPYTENGQPLVVWTTVPIVFELES